MHKSKLVASGAVTAVELLVWLRDAGCWFWRCVWKGEEDDEFGKATMAASFERAASWGWRDHSA